MKNILLVTQGASSSSEKVKQAAVECGRGLLHATTTHEALEILAESGDEIDVVVMDLDPGVHNVSVVEAISYREKAPLVIVIAGFDDMEMAAIANRHGAAACIPKPFTARELAALINDLWLPDWQRTGGSCDRWGHPYFTNGGRRAHSGYERAHCMAL